jgi:hypothetical protein
LNTSGIAASRHVSSTTGDGDCQMASITTSTRFSWNVSRDSRSG